jgi:hypothetical protein
MYPVMKGTPIRIFLLCALVATFALAVPQPATAIQGYERCVKVAPGCRECVDMPFYTGGCCHQVEPCYCIYVECPAFTATLSSETTQEGLLFVAEPAPMSPVSTADGAASFTPVQPAVDTEPSIPAAENPDGPTPAED